MPQEAVDDLDYSVESGNGKKSRISDNFWEVIARSRATWQSHFSEIAASLPRRRCKVLLCHRPTYPVQTETGMSLLVDLTRQISQSFHILFFLICVICEICGLKVVTYPDKDIVGHIFRICAAVCRICRSKKPVLQLHHPDLGKCISHTRYGLVGKHRIVTA